MIIGLGIDLVEIARMKKWVENEDLLNRFFSDQEIKDIKKAGKKSTQTAAVRFAAKEAFGKALGLGLSGFKLKEVSVNKDSRGKPMLVLSGKALLLFNKSGANSIFLSLSHEKEMGIAFVVIESNNE